MSCTKKHYWLRIKAWWSSRRFFDACDVIWTSVGESWPTTATTDRTRRFKVVFARLGSTAEEE